MVYSRKRKLNLKNRLRTIKRGGAANSYKTAHQLPNSAVNEICREEGAAAPAICGEGAAAPRRRSRSPRSRSPRRSPRSRSPRRTTRRKNSSPNEDITDFNIQFLTTEELVSHLKDIESAENKKIKDAGLKGRLSKLFSDITPSILKLKSKSKEKKWQENYRKDLVKIARNSLTQEAERRVMAGIRNNSMRAAKATPRFVKKIMDPGTGRVRDEEGVSVAKEWYAGIEALRVDAEAPSGGKAVPNITTMDGSIQPLKKGEVFMPFALLENILSIKITDKNPGTQGLVLRAADYKAKIAALEILINKVKKIHNGKRIGYRLVDFGKVGTKTPLYSKFRFPQKEFTYKQLNSLLRHKVFPESPGHGDGGVGASTRQVAAALKEVSLFPSTEGLVDRLPSTRHLVQKITPTKKKTGPIAVPK